MKVPSAWLGLAIATACGGSGSRDGAASTEEATAAASADDDGSGTDDRDATAGQTDPIADDADATASTGDPDDGTGEPDSGDPPGAAGPRYDQVQQKSAHNAYQRHEAIVDQLVYHRVRSIELDIHVGKTLQPTVDGRWYVYHSDVTDDDTSCRTLVDCLEELTVFAQAVPDHEVVTLWIDLKDDWDRAHSPAHLDAALDAVLGDAVLAPSELREACPGATSLAEVVTTCGWPSTDALRGRVIVALTGGGVNAATSNLSAYLVQGTRAFVAPDVDAAPAFQSPRDRRSPHPDVAIYNASAEQIGLAATVVDAGFVTRVWDLNEPDPWSTAARAGVHHLATDMVNLHEDPWTITHGGDGWPFTCLGACDDVGPEPGPTIGIAVDSGDIWGTADDAWFQYVDLSAAPAADWTALVSSANSHVEPFAKGCLMARASLDDSAPYFAACRPADEQPLRAQWRSTAGGSSEAVEDAIVAADTVSPTSVAWLRLTIDGDGTCATAWGAHRPDAWVEIATQCFDAPLVYQGLAASSHDAGTVRLLFVTPTLDDAEVALTDLTGVAIGSARASAFAGPLP